MTEPLSSNSTQPLKIVGRLSILDRFLPVWIFLAMAIGIGLGAVIPQIKDAFSALSIGTVSLPIAVGLIWMMYPVLAKVKYEELGKITEAKEQITLSLILNWVIGPAIMFILAWIFLPDLPGYRTGLIITGLARCIAMVLIWNMLAGGDSEYCAVLVALNSLFQIVMYSPLAYFYLRVVPGWLGFEKTIVQVSMWDIAKSVLIFLGIPLLAGALTRLILVRRKGVEWYDNDFAPRLGPSAYIGLLFASQEELATVIGALVEVPMLIGLVYVALWIKKRYFPPRAKVLVN